MGGRLRVKRNRRRAGAQRKQARRARAREAIVDPVYDAAGNLEGLLVIRRGRRRRMASTRIVGRGFKDATKVCCVVIGFLIFLGALVCLVVYLLSCMSGAPPHEVIIWIFGGMICAWGYEAVEQRMSQM